MRTAGFILILLSLLPGGCLAGAGYWYSRTASWIDAADAVPGVVVSYEERNGEDGVMYAPVFEYEHGGQLFTKVSSVSSHPKPYAEGAEIVVLVNPSKAHDAIIDSWSHKYLGPAVLAGLSIIPLLACLLIAVLLFVLARIKSKRKTR